MKLKTQKELIEEHVKEFPDSRRALEFKVKERQEAIKHIKKSEDGKDWICDMSEANIWIIHFFSITAEELK